MGRLTITLSDEMHRALKEAAARRRQSIGHLVEESLDLYGIKTSERAAELVASARERAGMTEQEAVDLAIEEIRTERRA